MISFLRKISDSIRDRIVKVADSEDDKRKRMYVIMSAAICVPAMFWLGVRHLAGGRTLNGLLVMAAVILMFGGLILLPSVRRIQPLYRAYLVALSSFVYWELAFGGASGHAVVWMYLFPLVIFYLFEIREGIIWLFVTLLLGVAGIVHGQEYYPLYHELVVRFAVTYGIVCVLAYGTEASRKRYHDKLKDEKLALEKSLKQVKKLHGLLPICAYCKKIRDDRGYWNQLESYIRDHSEADFSHGICPDCLHKLYDPNEKAE